MTSSAKYTALLLACVAATVGCASASTTPPQSVPAATVVDSKMAAHEAACDAGDGTACMRVGNALYTGEGAPKDIVRSLFFFERACTADDVEGCYAMGVQHEHGVDVPTVDPARAVVFYDKACTLGFLRSCVSAGALLAVEGTPHFDRLRAGQFLNKACERAGADGVQIIAVVKPEAQMKAQVDGCIELGTLHARSSTKSADTKRAIAAFERACVADPKTGCVLRDLYRLGKRFVAKDDHAFIAIVHACEAGIALACEAEKRASPSASE